MTKKGIDFPFQYELTLGFKICKNNRHKLIIPQGLHLIGDIPIYGSDRTFNLWRK